MSSVTWEDLQCGEAINVYGRHLLLMACDSSTKDWYARRGMKQRTLTVSQGEVEVRMGIRTTNEGSRNEEAGKETKYVFPNGAIRAKFNFFLDLDNSEGRSLAKATKGEDRTNR